MEFVRRDTKLGGSYCDELRAGSCSWRGMFALESSVPRKMRILLARVKRGMRHACCVARRVVLREGGGLATAMSPAAGYNCYCCKCWLFYSYWCCSSQYECDSAAAYWAYAERSAAWRPAQPSDVRRRIH